MTETSLERTTLDGSALPDEAGFDESLRPRRLDEMVGQDRLRENLAVFIRAARERREPLDHLLFHGPPGLGKTSLAHVVAREMGLPAIVGVSGATRWLSDGDRVRMNGRTGTVQKIGQPAREARHAR